MRKNPWKVLSKKTIHETDWIKVEHHDALNPKGAKSVYTTINFKSWAIGIVALDSNGNTFIVGQFRFPINEYSWEIPEGGGIKSKSPLASARRELLEETGISAKKWKLICKFNTSNSSTDELAYIFLAEDLTFGDSNPEDTEVLKVKSLAFKELVRLVFENKIKDSLTIIGVLMVDNFLKNRKFKKGNLRIVK